MAWSWYAAKSVYETTVGPGKDRRGDRLVEERIVLVKARSASEAMAKAEKEALRYTRGLRYKNYDGDLVQTKYIGALDVFTMDGEPAGGREVYSSSRIVSANMKTEDLLDILLGPEQSDEEQKARRRFEPDSPAEPDDLVSGDTT